MAKTVTSEKRGVSWLGKPRKLGSQAKATDFDPTEELRDPVIVRRAVLEAIEVGDEEAVATIIQAHLRVLNRSKTAAMMGASRQNVHRLIAGSRRPSLATLGAFMRLLKTEQPQPSAR